MPAARLALPLLTVYARCHVFNVSLLTLAGAGLSVTLNSSLEVPSAFSEPLSLLFLAVVLFSIAALCRHAIGAPLATSGSLPSRDEVRAQAQISLPAGRTHVALQPVSIFNRRQPVTS